MGWSSKKIGKSPNRLHPCKEFKSPKRRGLEITDHQAWTNALPRKPLPWKFNIDTPKKIHIWKEIWKYLLNKTCLGVSRQVSMLHFHGLNSITPPKKKLGLWNLANFERITCVIVSLKIQIPPNMSWEFFGIFTAEVANWNFLRRKRSQSTPPACHSWQCVVTGGSWCRVSWFLGRFWYPGSLQVSQHG